MAYIRKSGIWRKERLPQSEVADTVVSEAEATSVPEVASKKKKVDKVEKIKRNVREYSEVSARKWALVITSLLTIFILAILILMVAYLNVPLTVLNFGMAISGLGGLSALWTKGRSKLKIIISDRLYQRRIRKAKIDQIM